MTYQEENKICQESSVVVIFFYVLTFVGHNLVCLEEEGSVLQVHDLTLQLVLHHINQGQLITQVLIIYIQ